MSSSTVRAVSEFSSPNLETLFTAKQIQTRIAELGAEIARDYEGRNPLMIGVLKGACIFLSDLLRATDLPVGVEFIAISSYGASTRTSGEVKIVKDLDVPIEGRDIIVVEDIVDTGLTLSYLFSVLHSRGAYDSISATIFSQASFPEAWVARNSPVEISRKAAPTVSPCAQTAPR